MALGRRGSVVHAARTSSRGGLRDPLSRGGRWEGKGEAPFFEQRRFSFNYARRSSMDEMRQPFYIHEKRYGLFSNEHNVGKARRGLPFITPLFTKHMNLWETDTDASTNRFFRSYVFGQRELSQLLGRPHGFEADDSGGRQGLSAYELRTDLRYRGVPRAAMTDSHVEPVWNAPLYRPRANGSALADPGSPFTAAVLGPELLAVRDIKTLTDCQAWFARLEHLIRRHYDAVGDLDAFRSRQTRHVHAFFVAFEDALSGFEFQDRYLATALARARPAGLEDLFGIFLEMEGNTIAEGYCPRCSLPYATTRYCGEGDPETPFRRHRGRWAPHPRWGEEWYAVVVRRAEALWDRATEDPFFGTPHHTQRQAEALFRVYVKARRRAKAVDFVNALRGSKEFLLGEIQLSRVIQDGLDDLLDHTPHPHLLTNAFRVDHRAAVYTGETNTAPQSPLQVRLDLEINKYRRQQKEEGVVRVPPALWRLDTRAIVPYKLDANKQITNWREVKEGIETSFLATGLPKAAYTPQEWREMLYWEDYLAGRTQRRAALEAERRHDARLAGESPSPRPFIVFPDRHWYRVFDTSPEALGKFGFDEPGVVFTAATRTFEAATAVALTDPVSGAALRLNTTFEASRWFGDFEYGDVVEVDERKGEEGEEPTASARAVVVVVGVDTSDAAGEEMLYAMHVDRARHARNGLLALGKDCLDIRQRFARVRNTHRKRLIPLLDGEGGGGGGVGMRTMPEESLGQVVGVRDGELYVQWRLLKGGASRMDRDVAVSLGPPERVRALYRFQPREGEGGGRRWWSRRRGGRPSATTSPRSGWRRSGAAPSRASNGPPSSRANTPPR
ncbi:unnamed protein product [Phytomonas sp. EM1]|nr:unnamed protein product [Phytomonas sp. EM1]|eukprot:CCW64659.1 unnamed protein product [Phytomonas sp. isolate EM1]